MVAGRIAREYLAQVAGFAASIADRVLMTGLMIRGWGIDGFAFWTVALSVAGMVALAELGLSSYFGNRLFFAVEQGNGARARHMLSAGNLLLGIASLAGAVVATSLWFGFHPDKATGTSTLVVVASLVLAAAMRQAIAVQLAVYRAHREFSRQTWIVVLGDAARIAVIAVALWLGAGVALSAVLFLSATVIFSVALPLADVARRYHGFGWAAEAPAPQERRQAFVTSGQYWVQGGIATLFTFAPVFALSALGAGAFAIAQFALMRTLANLARAVLQLFANVFGLEVARRVAITDVAGAAGTYAESTRFLAVQTAAAAGALWAVASPLFNLWTGDPRLYDPLLFWLAIAAPLLLPSLSMAVQVLVCANWPKPLAIGRVTQLGMTLLLYALLPIGDQTLRMMAALAVGEAIGLGLPVVVALSRRIDGAGLALHLDLTLRSLAAGLIAWGGGAGGVALGGPSPLIAGCFGGGLGMLAATLLLALSPGRRAMLLGAARGRLSPARPRA